MQNIPLIIENSLVKFCTNHKDEATQLLKAARRTYGSISDLASGVLLPIADGVAKKWLQDTNNPFIEEIKQYAKTLGVSGVYALNISYEWGCSSGGFKSQSGGVDMLRVLDWPFPGLGSKVFVVKQESKAGAFYNITWPAVSGVFQAMAPGRFSAAINQAPMRRHGMTVAGDWLRNRNIMLKRDTLPPAHLLRQVFDSAKTYDDAKKILQETSVCIPVIYTLTGTEKGQACIIERSENHAIIREIGQGQNVCAANHFNGDFSERGTKGWRFRGELSHERESQISSMDSFSYMNKNEPGESDFSFLFPPVINRFTRLSMLANAKKGSLMLQGWEDKKPATNIFKL